LSEIVSFRMGKALLALRLWQGEALKARTLCSIIYDAMYSILRQVKRRSLLQSWMLALLAVRIGEAQIMDGELRVTVRDPAGRAVAARVRMTGRNPQFHAEAQTDANGQAWLRRLPRGVYRLAVHCAGLEEFIDTIEIRSAVPQQKEIALQIESVTTEITVEAPAPLIDPSQSGLVLRAGRDQLEQAFGTTLGRSTSEIITSMPGWLLEANAVLHPRGSEYDTQYVIDGMPVYDNRSIAFAPAFENGEFEAVSVMTAGIPAEYGRRLGGVVALDTHRIVRPGHASELDFQTGSYGTYLGSLFHRYRADSTAASLGVHAGHTGRYLDPPSIENFTNKASAGGVNVRLERDLTDRDRVVLYLRRNRTGFLVPNDLAQQASGQRQDRLSEETAGQIQYQHVFSPHSLASVHGLVRDLTARLWSNALSTPIYAEQSRGVREGAFAGNVTIDRQQHTLKFGSDFRTSRIRERFRFARPAGLPSFELDFEGRRRSVEAAAFVQDHVRLGNLAATAGCRIDHYRLLIRDTALGPRLGLSYYIPVADLLLRASYDRIFQPPPMENLLFSSAAPGLDLDRVEGALAVPASRANFFEAGFGKSLGNRLRADVSHYWRDFRNFIDDDVFLNTGLSFPIAFDRARVEGTEIRLELPGWRSVSSYASYSNMRGQASSPVTGGLFVNGGATEELRGFVKRFPVSQDQRNTVAAQVRVEAHRQLWIAAGVRYGSGLPVEAETEGEDVGANKGARGTLSIPSNILDRVNFERGRLRPNFSVDFGLGLRFWQRDERSVSLQIDLRNASNRFNVINFTGLLSGTALAAGRQVTVQIRTRF